MSAKDKWVRRFSVDETAKHKDGFTIYKITSVLFPIESPEAMTEVSVWKRYSDVQRLHKSMKTLHAGLHLRGTFPTLPRHSYFKRFQQEVIEERAKTLKTLLEFVAEHRLLFTSTDFVNFLQTGYPAPPPAAGGVINAIRSALHLPIEDTPPLEYRTDDDDDASSPQHSARRSEERAPISIDETDFISQIPIYEAAGVEILESPKNTTKTDSFESLSSIESIDSDLFEELNKLTIKTSKPSIKKSVLPDLITFDAPSTSNFEDYHTMPKNSVNVDYETVSLNSNSNLESTSSMFDMCLELDRRSSSKLSLHSKRSVRSLSNVECKTKTEDSYVFEAGYMLNLAARCEDMGDYQRAFECYKSGIEKMLIGVQTDGDPARRALIKEKTTKYLSYAEEIYKNHLCSVEHNPICERDSPRLHCPIPLSMLARPYSELAAYRVLGVLGPTVMLVLHERDNKCYAMKVIQKVPNNLTEFDEYFLQRTSENRTPILPTVIPYMVPLHAYIETNNLIFLILGCAPGEKLFDYIKNYAKSQPNTPAREVNLENVFTEPRKNLDAENNVQNNRLEHEDHNENVGKNENVRHSVNNSQNTSSTQKSEKVHKDNQNDVENRNPNRQYSNESEIDKVQSENESNIQSENENNVQSENKSNVHSESDNNASVDVLVLNSQRLLQNVDRVLTESESKVVVVDKEMNREVKSETASIHRLAIPLARPRAVLPPSAICKWGAEILTALESLHNSGVVCRDLNPSNILLGERGQIILTYCYSYPGLDMSLSKLRARNDSDVDMYMAPELYVNTILDDSEGQEYVCDFWSYGAIMYLLICGVPLSHYHRSVFTSHTLLQVPDGVSVEEESLLTQLLAYSPTERLGGAVSGVEDIKRHPYFKHIHWQHIYDTWLVPD